MIILEPEEDAFINKSDNYEAKFIIRMALFQHIVTFLIVSHLGITATQRLGRHYFPYFIDKEINLVRGCVKLYI